MDDLAADLAGKVLGQGEGPHDEAVSVHHVGRDRPVVRVAVLLV